MEAVAEVDDDLLMKYWRALDRSGKALAQESWAESYSRSLRFAVKNYGMQPLLDMIVNYLPPRKSGQRQGWLPAGGRSLREPSEDAPLSVFVFKTLADPYVGRINYFRVNSGKLKPDSQVYNATKDKMERIGQLFSMRGKNQIMMEEVVAGDIAAVAKLQHTSTGDTLCDRNNPILFSPVTFRAVISFAVVPKAKETRRRLVPAWLALWKRITLSGGAATETRQLVISGWRCT